MAIFGYAASLSMACQKEGLYLPLVLSLTNRLTKNKHGLSSFHSVLKISRGIKPVFL
jgi:hypothetical protein